MIALIGSGLPYLLAGEAGGLYLAVGCVSIALGLGFTYAADTLRWILRAAPRPLAPREAQAQAGVAA